MSEDVYLSEAKKLGELVDCPMGGKVDIENCFECPQFNGEVYIVVKCVQCRRREWQVDITKIKESEVLPVCEKCRLLNTRKGEPKKNLDQPKMVTGKALVCTVPKQYINKVSTHVKRRFKIKG